MTGGNIVLAALAHINLGLLDARELDAVGRALAADVTVPDGGEAYADWRSRDPYGRCDWGRDAAAFTFWRASRGVGVPANYVLRLAYAQGFRWAA